jgi:hypothetical protein
MPRNSQRWPSALGAIGIGLALALLGCGTGGKTSSPGTSTAAACATAPAPPDDLAGWGPPSAAPTVVPLLINSAGEVACGPNRILFTILDGSNAPIAAPDRTSSVTFYNLGRDPSTPIAKVDGTFVWAIENVRGIYLANTSFPEAGRYGAEFTTAAAGAAPVSVRLTFDVQPSSPVVRVGDHAPASKTPTLADVGGDASHVSTDTNPDSAFYKTSVDQAIAKHEPFVLIFATPKFCKSAQCGPTLDRIKPFAARYPGLTFINVEPYKLKLVDGILQADTDADGQLQATTVTDEWHLISEPSVYVVDRDGIVRANFELIFSDAELTAALDAIK